MQHQGTVKIETDRLILRRFTHEDSAAMFRNWASDEQVTKHLTWPTHTGVDVSEKVINTWLDGYARDNFYQWAIVLRENGDEPIGSISVVEQNEAVKQMEIGYCIGRKWWHQGITSEAFAGVIAFLFDSVKANRIAAIHDPRNENSGKVMRKCGLTLEGILRQAYRSNQGIIDVAVYGLLADEYYHC